MKSSTTRKRRKAAAAWALAVAGWAGVGLASAIGLEGGSAYAQSAPEWKTFQVRNASAATMQPVLEQALAGREAGAQVVANPQANQIHVRGSLELQSLAGQLVQTLDLPGQNPRPAAPAAAGPAIEVRSYPCGPTQLAATAARLQTQFAAHPEVRIAADARVGQILVAAPAEWQERVAGQLAAAPAPSTRGQLEGHQVRLGPPQTGGEAEAPSMRNAPAYPTAGSAVPAPRATERAPAPSFVPQTRSTPPAAAPVAAPAARTAALAPAAPRFAPAAGAAPAPGPRGVLVSLEATPWNQVLAGLQGLWGGRLTAYPDPHPDLGMLRYDGPKGEVLEIQVNRRSHQFAIDGTPPLRAAAVRLVQMLDRGPPPAGQAMRVVGFQNTRPAKIQKAVLAYRGEQSEGEPAPKAAEAPKPLWRNDQSPLVKKIFRQVPGGPTPRDPNAPRNPDDPNDPNNTQPPPPPVEQPPEDFRGGTFGQVQIEYVEGLDAFVIRGSEKDVAKITAIIDDLERLSKETEPEIEVFMLKNVASDALAQLALQLYDEILGSRLGRVSITPLGKPNAILLIGPAESVKLIKELLVRLDQPVGPASQFEVFRLKHVAAATAQTTITNFYANRTGLGTRVQVSADFRTNSLLVQASPRDTAEISLLLKRIDSDENESVNELRLFPLQNAAADQLAAILTNSIAPPGGTGAGAGAAGAGQAQNQPLIPGVGAAAVGGAAGQAGGASAGPRSTTLRFLTIDQQGQQKLRSGILTDVRITADVRANALLVSAPPESMELIAALIRELDRIPTSESQIKVFTIVNGDAPSLSTMLGQLFGSTTQGAGGGGFGGFGGLGGAGGLQGNQLVTPMRFSVDQRTNSIIASGSADDLRIVEAILLRLDGSDVQDRKTEVFRLKNSPAADVSNAINQYLQNERAVQQNNPALLSAFEQIERQVVVVPEPVSNSLIVSATPRYFDEIRNIVEKLDARPPMVLIQVLIAEITLNSTDEFGIELGLQDSVLFDRSVAAAGSLVPGYNFNNQPLGNTATPVVNPAYVGGQGLTNFSLGRTNPTLGYGGLVLSASSENVSFLLRALKECRRLDVLSRPQVMTLDNQPAFIQVGQRVPRITGSTTNQTGQTNSTVLENVGLILGVTPRISPDNLVVMEVDAERSEVGPEAEGIPISISATGQVIRSPRINTTTAQTTVSALTGQTVVLGGLLTKNRQTTHRSVPVLDNIPVIRNLFRYDIETELRTELLIILTPNVVRTEEESERLKRIEASRMSWCLADVQKMHGEAGLTPIPGEFSGPNDGADPNTTVVYGAPLPKGAQLIEGPTATPPAGSLPPGTFPPGTKVEDVGPGLLMPPAGSDGPGLQPAPSPPADAVPAAPPGGSPSAATSRRNAKRN